MPGALGRRRWAIAEGYIPSSSHGPEPQMTSHETACLLNAGERDARGDDHRLLRRPRAGRSPTR